MKAPEESQRLSKYLAAAGIASRRACETLIFDGKVTVDGKVITVPQTPVSGKEKIFVYGKEVIPPQKHLYYLLNKPIDYICSTRPTPKSKSVYRLFPKTASRLFTVGRLDVATSGLLLVTNDGHFAQKIAHPSAEIEKEYIAKVDGDIDNRCLGLIAKGTVVEGRHVKPKKVIRLRYGRLAIVVTDGRKREVRCMIKDAGLKVLELKRIRIGGLILGDLPEGSWRTLSLEERALIFKKYKRERR